MQLVAYRCDQVLAVIAHGSSLHWILRRIAQSCQADQGCGQAIPKASSLCRGSSMHATSFAQADHAACIHDSKPLRTKVCSCVMHTGTLPKFEEHYGKQTAKQQRRSGMRRLFDCLNPASGCINPPQHQGWQGKRYQSFADGVLPHLTSPTCMILLIVHHEVELSSLCVSNTSIQVCLATQTMNIAAVHMHCN